MTMPNFLITGAGKAGTDALYYYLSQHPEVYMSPVKEPMFFVSEGHPHPPYQGPRDRESLERFAYWTPDLETYLALFSGAAGQKAIGEASTWYLYHPGAPANIKRYVPSVRLVVVLRDPVDRAYSAYNMMLREGREPLSDFAAAMAAEDARVDADWEPFWHLRRMGLYSVQLKRYYELFDATQIKIVLYDEFLAKPMAVLQDIFRYLEVDDRLELDVSQRFNVSVVPRSVTLTRAIKNQGVARMVAKSLIPTPVRHPLRDWILSRNTVKPEPLEPGLRSELIELFRADIAEVESLIGRDLQHWLSVTPRGAARGVAAHGACQANPA